MFETLNQSFLATVAQLEGDVYWLVLSYLVLSEFGVPIPLPGALVLVAGGFLLGQSGELPLLLIAGATLATIPGATTLYWVGKRGGQPLLRKLGPRLGLTAERQERIIRQLEDKALIGLVTLRILPLVRVGTTFVPGAIGMPWPQYALGMGCALIAWPTVYVGAGYGLALWGQAGLIAAPLLALAAGLFIWWRRRSAAKPEGLL